MISSRNAPPVISVGIEDFEKKVIQESRPVLLLCAYRDSDFKALLDNMNEIKGEMKGGFDKKLVKCVLDEAFVGIFMKRYNVKGTPTFIIFMGGCEKGRLLGEADREMLNDFVSETIKNLT